MCSFGTDEYITHLTETYGNALLRLACTILRSAADAEDAVQEAFVRLIIHAPRFSSSAHERAWLFRVVINISRNMLKSSARKELPLDDTLPCAQTEDSDIRELMLSLPEKYSTVLHLYYYEGYSIKEIADIIKRPPATVGTQLARARGLLKAKLEGDENL